MLSFFSLLIAESRNFSNFWPMAYSNPLLVFFSGDFSFDLITGLDSLELSAGVVVAVVVVGVVVGGVTGVGGTNLDFLETLITFFKVVGRDSVGEKPISLSVIVPENDFSSDVDLELDAVVVVVLEIGAVSAMLGIATPLRVIFLRSLGVASLVAG